MKDRGKVSFIAYQDQENLGIGYLTSMLLAKGFDVEIIDFRLPKEEILRQLKKADPLIVGFSLIFQYYVEKLRKLVQYLREHSVACHFTVGGHYPSLRYYEVLNIIPDLDSVVRFEGENTICELAEGLIAGKDWRKIKGMAYRLHDKPVSNELRPLIKDLDTLPFPFREKGKEYKCMDKVYHTILASRGCVRNCSFCSIRKFYGTPRGQIRRTRSPYNVSKEMQKLYTEYKTRIFLFQDDDFFLPGRLGEKWVLDFIAALEAEGLANKILWKINCRPDEVNLDLFSKLKKVGLYLTYLGIETGNQTGLKVLNKKLSLDDSVTSVRVLNQLGISYEFGFMLFDPSSTFQSIKDNLTFLRKICGDGSAPVVFCKMIPYAETDIERQLKEENRLKGSVENPDYDFLDPKVDRLCTFLHHAFYNWMFTSEGMLAKLRWHRFEVVVLKKFYPQVKNISEYEEFLRGIIASSNQLFLNIAEESASIYEDYKSSSEYQLSSLTELLNTELRKIDINLYNGMLQFQTT